MFFPFILFFWMFVLPLTETIEIIRCLGELGSKHFLTLTSQEGRGGNSCPDVPGNCQQLLAFACWPLALSSLKQERTDLWSWCFLEQMGAWESEEREESIFWLIWVLFQHLCACLVKRLCFSSQGLFWLLKWPAREGAVRNNSSFKDPVLKSQEKVPDVIWF